MNVLLVDDAASVREHLGSLVRAVPGVDSVMEAEDSITALDAIARAAPDLIVLDLNLPGVSGLELLPIMKERVPGAVVVVLTNHTGPAYEVRCRVLGADYFFDKSRQFHRAVEVVRAGRQRPSLQRPGGDQT
jgi:DNA-binding NarL/FixJ family response regulator